MNRIATVKDDGTVEFEVPVDVEPRSLGAGSNSICTEVDEEVLDTTDIQYIPPLQIVMLIVGTRGDVQPFVAIGKRLQVESIIYCTTLYSLTITKGHSGLTNYLCLLFEVSMHISNHIFMLPLHPNLCGKNQNP